jgi:hypothetical protein
MTVENRVSGLKDFLRRAWFQGKNKKLYSQEGFKLVYPKHYWQLIYCERDRTLTLITEIRGGKSWWDAWEAVHMEGELRWDPPYDREIIDANAKARILTNLRKAYAAKSMAVEFVLE